MTVVMCPKCGNYYRPERPHTCLTVPLGAEGYQHSEGAHLLTDAQIMDECAALDDVAGDKAGYAIHRVGIGDVWDSRLVRKIDGMGVRFQDSDRFLPLADFSTRIIRPLITARRGSPPKPVVILSEEAPPETVRGTTHGDYTEMSQVIQETKAIWRSGSSWGKLTAGQKEALELIATKVGRIVTGDPTHLDHWRDGAGYFNKGSESCGS